MRTIMSLLICILLQTNAIAQQSQPEQITIDQALQEAVDHNLTLLAEKYNLSVADARIVTARLRPNPVLSVGWDYLDWLGAGFNVNNNTGPTEANIRVDYLLERGKKRESRIESAENARAVSEMQLLNTTRLLLLDMINGCVDFLLAKENLALAKENLRAFNEIVKVNEVRVNAGDLAKVELVRTRVAALQFQNSVLQGEAKLRTARNRIQTLLGRQSPTPGFDIVGDFRRDAEPLSLRELQGQALQSRPDLQALVRDQARSTADLRLQIAQGKVDFTIGTQFHRQYGAALTAPGNALGLFFSAPLPLFNRNQGEIARATQEQHQIGARLLALQADVRQEVSAAYQQYVTAKDLLTTIERDMLKQATEVRSATEYSYRRGEASLVEFLDAQRAFNDTMQAYNEARAEYARSLYILDSTSGKMVKP